MFSSNKALPKPYLIGKIIDNNFILFPSSKREKRNLWVLLAAPLHITLMEMELSDCE